MYAHLYIYVYCSHEILQSTQEESFNRMIHEFADQSCHICLKKCYSNQVSNIDLNNVHAEYLPHQLASRRQLIMCWRCKAHLKSSNRDAPPKAYWNDLDPGPIPPELDGLTEVEVQLLARIIPFIKIVKYSGVFGQYGCKGQAILFAQDVFEVTEKLPTMLPRCSKETGFIVVTEHLDNINIDRQLTMRPQVVFKALQWLKENNTLYQDVVVDKEVVLSEEDFLSVLHRNVRIHDHHTKVGEVEKNVVPEIINAYVPINSLSRILRASWHQGDARVFTSG